MPSMVRGESNTTGSAAAARALLVYQQLLEKLPAAACVCNAQGQITGFNTHAVELWGRTPKLNDAEELYCGSWKILRTDGSPVPLDQCYAALALRNGQDYHGREAVIEALTVASPARDHGETA